MRDGPDAPAIVGLLVVIFIGIAFIFGLYEECSGGPHKEQIKAAIAERINDPVKSAVEDCEARRGQLLFSYDQWGSAKPYLCVPEGVTFHGLCAEAKE